MTLDEYCDPGRFPLTTAKHKLSPKGRCCRTPSTTTS
jgi:hypothetical protein